MMEETWIAHELWLAAHAEKAMTKRFVLLVARLLKAKGTPAPPVEKD